MEVLPQTWDNVRERFRRLPEDSPLRRSMLKLIDHIAESDLGDSLYPWTSMFELRITQTRNHPFGNEPYLVISPFTDGRLEFRYVDTLVRSKQWVRVTKQDQPTSLFDKFIDQLHWRGK